MGRDLALLKRVATESGLPIVASGGYYMERTYPPDIAAKSDDRIADELARRRSVRQFSERAVPRALIETCLRAAVTAPSGANLQPWHFVAVADPAVKRRLRAAAEGYTVGVIPSTTYEEACGRYWPWIRQRTRWIKGYMQTGLVHTRRPIKTAKAAGVRGVFGLLLLIIGTPLTFLLAPVMAFFTVLWLLSFLGLPTALPDLLPGPMEAIGAINLIVGNAMMVALNRSEELALHLRAAKNNGVTRAQIKEVLLQTAIYCGVPAANSAFHLAQKIFDEDDRAA